MANQTTNNPTRRYTAESCHEVGYSWRIEAPSTLDPAQVQGLQQALVAWSDEPKPEHVGDVLNDADYCEEFDLRSIDELRKVTIYAESVHRDFWAQSFAPVKGGAS